MEIKHVKHPAVHATMNRTCSECQELRQYLIWDSEGISETEDKMLEEMFEAADKDEDDSEDSMVARKRKREALLKKEKKKRKSSGSDSAGSASSACSESEANQGRMS